MYSCSVGLLVLFIVISFDSGVAALANPCIVLFVIRITLSIVVFICIYLLLCVSFLHVLFFLLLSPIQYIELYFLVQCENERAYALIPSIHHRLSQKTGLDLINNQYRW